MLTNQVGLMQAFCLDFTGTVDEFNQFSEFNDSVISSIRNWNGNKVLIVVDTAYELKSATPHIVHDHLNLTGSNPLVGPNDPIGERFPSVNNIYITEGFSNYPQAVAAGLTPGITPTAKELDLIFSIGAGFYCYNLVPAAIIAAHAKWKIIAIARPENADIKPILSCALNLVSEGKI